MDAETNAYFTQMAQKYGLSVEDLINLYLTDCVKKNRVLEVSFPEPSK